MSSEVKFRAASPASSFNPPPAQGGRMSPQVFDAMARLGSMSPTGAGTDRGFQRVLSSPPGMPIVKEGDSPNISRTGSPARELSDRVTHLRLDVTAPTECKHLLAPIGAEAEQRQQIARLQLDLLLLPTNCRKVFNSIYPGLARAVEANEQNPPMPVDQSKNWKSFGIISDRQ